MSVEMLSDDDQRQRAWSVYLEHMGVFHAVLRRTGPWGISEGVDVINDFVVDRLPKALNTYDPSVGELSPWLYAIFDRYARRKRGRIARTADRAIHLGHFADELPARQPAVEAFTTAQLIVFQHTLEDVPHDVKQVLHSYFDPGPSAGSFRAIAEQFAISRHESKQRVFSALAAVLARLKPHELFSSDEFEAARRYLEGGITQSEIAVERGEPREEFGSVLRSSLETLLRGVTKALAAEAVTSGESMSTKELFLELVEAIKKCDAERLDRLREDWEQIGAFVERNSEFAQSVRLSQDDEAALILWLSTPPSPKPIPWTELKEPGFLVEGRDHQLDLVNQLWSAWHDQRILAQLERALRSFRHRDAWMGHAKRFFHHLIHHMSSLEQPEGRDVRLQVVIGYAAFVDQRLLAQLGYPRAWLEINILKDTLLLVGPDESPITCDALGTGITFTSGVVDGLATRLAEAVTLSLPAHQEVLPKIAVELKPNACRLIPSGDDLFAERVRRRQQHNEELAVGK